MKKLKLLFMGVIAAFTMYSCSSDENVATGEAEEAAVPVKFTIEQFTQEVDGMLKSSSPEEAGLTNLSFYTFNEEGKFLSREDLNLSFVEPVIKTWLRPGTYYVSFMATTGTDFRHYTNYGGDGMYDDFHIIMFGNGDELFYSTFKITVTSNEAIERQVTLERITGKVEIYIQDADRIPANVTNISTYVAPFPGYFYFSTGITKQLGPNYGSGSYGPDVIFELTPDKPLTFFLLPTMDVEEPYELRLLISDENDPSFGRTVVLSNRLRVEKNKVTRLRGKLFGDNPFPIVVDTEWETEIIEDVFDNTF